MYSLLSLTWEEKTSQRRRHLIKPLYIEKIRQKKRRKGNKADYKVYQNKWIKTPIIDLVTPLDKISSVSILDLYFHAYPIRVGLKF